MRRLLAQTFAIQGFGVALMLGITLLVSRVGGLESQGSFALVKSSTDLQVAIFSLGLPPAIVFLINSTGNGHAAIYRHVMRYGALLFVALPMLNFLVLLGAAPDAKVTHSAIQAVAIGIASASLTLFALLRGLLLVHTDGPVFSAISVLQWVVIAVVALGLLNRSAFVFEFSYALAGMASLTIMIACLRKYAVRALSTAESPQTHAGDNAADVIDWRILCAQSVHVLLQSVLFGLQPFLTNAALATLQDGITQVGLFSISSLVVTLPNLLVALVAPVLFNRWSKSLKWSGMSAISRNALVIGIGAQGLAVLAMPLVAPTIRLMFGQSFAGSASAAQILLLATCPIISGRILTPALQGLGHSNFVTLTCAIRLLVSAAVGGALLLWASPPLIAMATGWCGGEYAAFAALLWRIKRGQRLSSMQ